MTPNGGRVGGLSPVKMGSLPRRSSPLVPTSNNASKPQPTSGHPPKRAASMSIVPTPPPRVLNSASRFASDSYEPPSPTPTCRTFTPTSGHVRRPSAPSPNPSSLEGGVLPVLPSSYQSSSVASSSGSMLGGMEEEEGESESEKVTSGGGGGERYGATLVGTNGGGGGGIQGGTVRSMMSSRWDEGTEPGDREIDEELEDALGAVRVTAQERITQYKRLLEQSQTSSSYQLHALQAELKNAKYELEVQKRARDAALKTAAQRPKPPPPSLMFPPSSSMSRNLSSFSFDFSTPLGSNGFDEVAVRGWVRGMKQDDRQTLLRMILESLLPGDVNKMIRTLERYALSSFDVLGSLPDEIATEILKEFEVKELLDLGLVSTRWRALVRSADLWRYHTLALADGDPVLPREPDSEEDWLPLYKGLYFREQNWSRGLAQNIKVLKGHSNFVTSLDVHGDVLITGSYDETIRVWDLPSGTCKLVLKAKAVSCLAFCAESNVFAAGFHDIGRTQVWSSITWQPLQTLGGHLHGIRAVDINDRYIVSAGADKAIVVSDWRSGTKVTRFGQQTNVNIGVQLIGDGDRIVSVTLDGIIRCFSISRREMISQWKLSEMGGSDFATSLRLTDVGGGHLGAGQLCWMAAKGLHLTCATKVSRRLEALLRNTLMLSSSASQNLIIHLQWTEGDELVLDDPLLQNKPAPSTTTTPTPRQRTSSTFSSTPPRRAPSGSSSTSSNLLQNTPSPQSMRSRTMSTMSSSSFGGRGGGSPSTPTFGRQAAQVAPPSTTPRSPAFSLAVKKGVPGTRLKRVANLGKRPILVSLVDSPTDVSIGFVDPGKRRVITSTRFSTRPGAEKNLFLSTFSASSSSKPLVPSTPTSPLPSFDSQSPPPSPIGSLVPTYLRGAWEEAADELGLRTAGMGPMSLGLDHEKIVVGTAGGDVYVVGMTGFGYREGGEEWA
ncbi:hypothetical protein BDY24DRAFT_404916 [Mrakia frigida]|uniref:F-box/WD repeat-containing protein n=1 Tax=Mrakia frigida TaxID=29902 RepID=UPI003FCBEED0